MTVLAGCLFVLAIFGVGYSQMPRGADRDGAPPAQEVRDGLVQGGFTDKAHSGCVEKLLRSSRVSTSVLKEIARNPKDWTIPEGAEQDFFSIDVKAKMLDECGAKAWAP